MNELDIPNQPQHSHGLQAMHAAGAIAPAGVNAGAVSIEIERAIAEKRGQMQLAKMFPRSEQTAIARLIDSCRVLAFAETAFYAVPNRGSGPSIRFAEEVARVYGNMQYGHRELSRTATSSEVEVFAWDVENNNYSTRQITVEHVIDTKQGPKKCRDQSEIDNLIANKASKQMRGRILALLPKSLVAIGIAECKKTLNGDNSEPMVTRVARMVQSFGKYGVTAKHLSAYIGHSLDDVLSDELADLQGVFNAIKEGAKPSDYFELADAKSTGPDLNAALAAAQKAEQQVQPEPEKQAQPEPAPRPTRTRTPAQAPAVEKAQQSTPAEAPKPQRQAKPPAPEPEEQPLPEPDDVPLEDGPMF